MQVLKIVMLKWIDGITPPSFIAKGSGQVFFTPLLLVR